jgi:hypothetical protein
MDLTKFNPKITAEAGYTFNVELPNGTITDIEITVRGEDSPAVRAHSRKMFDEYRNREALARRQKREVPDLTLDELEKSNIEVHYLGYYLRWTPQEVYYYAVENTGFQARPFRTQGTYSKYNSIDDKIDDLHFYTTFIKFGIGRASDTFIQVFWVEIFHPPLFEAFNLMEKLPTLKVWIGFCEVLKLNGVLFPVTFVAFHCQAVGKLVEVSLNWTGNGLAPAVKLAVKDATGGSEYLIITIPDPPFPPGPRVYCAPPPPPPNPSVPAPADIPPPVPPPPAPPSDAVKLFAPPPPPA